MSTWILITSWFLAGLVACIILQWIPPRNRATESDIRIGLVLGWVGLLVVLVYLIGCGFKQTIQLIFGSVHWLFDGIVDLVQLFGPRK